MKLLHNIQESVNLNDNDFKNSIEYLIKTIIDDSRIAITLKQVNATLKQQKHKLSVTLLTGIDNQFEKNNIIISVLNVLSDEKKKNTVILSQLKQELNLIDGSNLTIDLLLTDERVWNFIHQKIQSIITIDDYSKIKVSNPLSFLNSVSITSFANRWSKTATLESTKCTINVLIKVGSGKDQVIDLILVKFYDVKY